MKHLRWWILAAAFGTFAAGMSVGAAIPRVQAAWSDRPSGREVDFGYARSLADTYGLDAEQQRILGMVMLSSRAEEESVLAELSLSQLPAETQRRLLSVRSRTEKRVRAVLSDKQRERYDRDRDGRVGTELVGR